VQDDAQTPPTTGNDHGGAPHRSPLHDRHVAAGAKLAPFAGWQMPLSYAGTVAEHRAVRSSVGVFDVSHLGTVWVTGPAATIAVDRAFTADATAIPDGGSRYVLCTDEDGGIVDDLIVYRIAAERWLVIPNAVNTAAVVARLRTASADVAAEAAPRVAVAAAAADPDPAELAVGTALVDDASTAWAIVAVQGPDALPTVTAALGTPAADVPWGQLREVVAGEEVGRPGRYLLCRTGYTGEPGVELVVPAELSGGVWDAIVSAGATPCGLGARDTLRLEMGYPLHGNELGPDVTPAEARLSWAVQLTDQHGEPRRFPGAVAIAAAAASGPARRSWGLRVEGRRPLRAGSEVRRDGEVVGRTTSGGFSPSLEVGIGLGLLDAAVRPGDEVEVEVRGKVVAAEVVRPPFVDRDPKA
jgi:aminomethyltransferase